VRALAILWVLVLHMVYFHYANFPAEVMAIFNGPATGWIKMEAWASISSS
jgi:hypothetical protein